MTTVLSALTGLGALLAQAPAPEDTKPGLGAFLVILMLALAVAFLGYSLSKHLRKARANFEARDARDREQDGRPGDGPRG